MRLVVIESPYSGDIERNLIYLHNCIKDCISRGETPYASHLMLTGALDDGNPEERVVGIEAGLHWADAAEAVVVYTDYGISEGMVSSIAAHEVAGRTIEKRAIGLRCNDTVEMF